MAKRPRKQNYTIRDGEKYNGPYRLRDDGSPLGDFEIFDSLPENLREYWRIRPYLHVDEVIWAYAPRRKAK